MKNTTISNNSGGGSSNQNTDDEEDIDIMNDSDSEVTLSLRTSLQNNINNNRNNNNNNSSNTTIKNNKYTSSPKNNNSRSRKLTNTSSRNKKYKSKSSLEIESSDDELDEYSTSELKEREYWEKYERKVYEENQMKLKRSRKATLVDKELERFISSNIFDDTIPKEAYESEEKVQLKSTFDSSLMPNTGEKVMIPNYKELDEYEISDGYDNDKSKEFFNLYSSKLIDYASLESREEIVEIEYDPILSTSTRLKPAVNPLQNSTNSTVGIISLSKKRKASKANIFQSSIEENTTINEDENNNNNNNNNSIVNINIKKNNSKPSPSNNKKLKKTINIDTELDDNDNDEDEDDDDDDIVITDDIDFVGLGNSDQSSSSPIISYTKKKSSISSTPKITKTKPKPPTRKSKSITSKRSSKKSSKKSKSKRNKIPIYDYSDSSDDSSDMEINISADSDSDQSDSEMANLNITSPSPSSSDSESSLSPSLYNNDFPSDSETPNLVQQTITSKLKNTNTINNNNTNNIIKEKETMYPLSTFGGEHFHNMSFLAPFSPMAFPIASPLSPGIMFDMGSIEPFSPLSPLSPLMSPVSPSFITTNSSLNSNISLTQYGTQSQSITNNKNNILSPSLSNPSIFSNNSILSNIITTPSPTITNVLSIPPPPPSPLSTSTSSTPLTATNTTTTTITSSSSMSPPPIKSEPITTITTTTNSQLKKNKRFTMTPHVQKHFQPTIWHEEEKMFFKELFYAYGRDWPIISVLMCGTKSPTQVKSFYYECRLTLLAPLIGITESGENSGSGQKSGRLTIPNQSDQPPTTIQQLQQQQQQQAITSSGTINANNNNSNSSPIKRLAISDDDIKTAKKKSRFSKRTFRFSRVTTSVTRTPKFVPKPSKNKTQDQPPNVKYPIGGSAFYFYKNPESFPVGKWFEVKILEYDNSIFEKQQQQQQEQEQTKQQQQQQQDQKMDSIPILSLDLEMSFNDSLNLANNDQNDIESLVNFNSVNNNNNNNNSNSNISNICLVRYKVVMFNMNKTKGFWVNDDELRMELPVGEEIWEFSADPLVDEQQQQIQQQQQQDIANNGIEGIYSNALQPPPELQSQEPMDYVSKLVDSLINSIDKIKLQNWLESRIETMTPSSTTKFPYVEDPKLLSKELLEIPAFSLEYLHSPSGSSSIVQKQKCFIEIITSHFDEKDIVSINFSSIFSNYQFIPDINDKTFIIQLFDNVLKASDLSVTSIVSKVSVNSSATSPTPTSNPDDSILVKKEIPTIKPEIKNTTTITSNNGIKPTTAPIKTLQPPTVTTYKPSTTTAPIPQPTTSKLKPISTSTNQQNIVQTSTTTNTTTSPMISKPQNITRNPVTNTPGIVKSTTTPMVSTLPTSNKTTQPITVTSKSAPGVNSNVKSVTTTPGTTTPPPGTTSMKAQPIVSGQPIPSNGKIPPQPIYAKPKMVTLPNGQKIYTCSCCVHKNPPGTVIPPQYKIASIPPGSKPPPGTNTTTVVNGVSKVVTTTATTGGLPVSKLPPTIPNSTPRVPLKNAPVTTTTAPTIISKPTGTISTTILKSTPSSTTYIPPSTSSSTTSMTSTISTNGSSINLTTTLSTTTTNIPPTLSTVVSTSVNTNFNLLFNPDKSSIPYRLFIGKRELLLECRRLLRIQCTRISHLNKQNIEGGKDTAEVITRMKELTTELSQFKYLLLETASDRYTIYKKSIGVHF
ncbi:myb domain-containing protein [Tieghemostelium lacteum]|uniref:Myb domain-containing protein n=1 Tax=Tieghemostelium lacteum TaxID=361077 RepID=A0A152A565_TIELA|nr:myb domain-containing protein [Tieghemostelium lacteum]|eukprot:KYR01205.1 myb domain-containing protein [Tieghemostelium lacteum]